MQGLVDVDALFSLLACSASQTLLFRAGQIDELQLGYGHVDWLADVLRLDRQAEDRV